MNFMTGEINVINNCCRSDESSCHGHWGYDDHRENCQTYTEYTQCWGKYVHSCLELKCALWKKG